MRRHPSDARLRRWLDADADVDVDADLMTAATHLDTCARCAARIEQLLTAEAPPAASDLGPALLALLTPPAGMTERVESRVVDRLGSRQMVVVIGDLLGAALETSRLLLTEEGR